MNLFKKEEEKIVSKYDELEQLIWDFFMTKLPKLGFESREGQEDMALDICSSIKENQHTIVEAGVGIGKSYAYLVPLLYYNKLFNKPVLVATSTIALQEQLIKDIKKVSQYINYKIDIVLAKGMNHFACRSRAEKYFNNIDFINIKKDEDMLYRYINIGKADRKNINYDFKDELWNNVNVVPANHKKCEYYNSCPFMELRRRMQECNGIIICNQDLLTVHLQKVVSGKSGLINPDIDLIVIDEAHNLEDKVRSPLIQTYTEKKMKFIINQSLYNIENKVERQRNIKNINYINNIIKDIFEGLNIQIKNQVNSSNNDECEKFFLDTITIKEKFIVLLKEVGNIYRNIESDNSQIIWDESVEELQELLSFFNLVISGEENNILWLEKYDEIEVKSCPKNIENNIKKLYFDKSKTTILTSATLVDNGRNNEEKQYEYFTRSIGFPVKKGFLVPPKESPFPYNKNTLLYYKNNMPHPTYERKEFISKATDEIIRLLDITNGKSLILFTSKKDLNEVYSILIKEGFKYNIIKQKGISSQSDVIENFKEDVNSVLLATGSFWEGVDISGEALSNLIIFKLPFPVPDPIIEEKRKNANNFLKEVAVPLMIVKLRQGIGRLIRKETDKGIVSILDPRIGDIANNEYRDIVFNSIPIKNKTSEIMEVNYFWKRMCREDENEKDKK